MGTGANQCPQASCFISHLSMSCTLTHIKYFNELLRRPLKVSPIAAATFATLHRHTHTLLLTVLCQLSPQLLYRTLLAGGRHGMATPLSCPLLPPPNQGQCKAGALSCARLPARPAGSHHRRHAKLEARPHAPTTLSACAPPAAAAPQYACSAWWLRRAAQWRSITRSSVAREVSSTCPLTGVSSCGEASVRPLGFACATAYCSYTSGAAPSGQRRKRSHPSAAASFAPTCQRVRVRVRVEGEGGG